MWTLNLDRRAREIASFCEDVKQLYEMLVEMYRPQETREREVELIEREIPRLPQLCV